MIDRRIFLQLTGGAAAGAAGLAGSTPANATGAAFPSAAPSSVAVGDGVVSRLADPLRLLSDRLAQASGGRLSLDALSAASTAQFSPKQRIILASEEAFAEEEPASLLLAGYAVGAQASEFDMTTWLRGAGGQGLWDMSAGRRGWKPLMVDGAGGANAHVWSRTPLETSRDLAGLRIAAPGGVHVPLTALDAVPVRAEDGLSAFEAGTIDVLETDDLADSLAAAERLGDRVHWYMGSLTGTCRVISLRVPLAQWEGLSPADQALLEAVAQETASTLQAVQRAHGRLLTRQMAQARRQQPQSLPLSVREALGREALRLLPQSVREEPVFASMLASMTALVGSRADFDRQWPVA